MILIDTVYQRVLAIANKEQRGYITPLEFNLLANQASLDVFEQYFYDLNQFERVTAEKPSLSDMSELIKNKLTAFTTIENVTGGGVIYPPNYRTGKIYAGDYEAKLVTINEVRRLLDSQFHRMGLVKNPVYIESRHSGQDIRVFDGVSISGRLTLGVRVEVITAPVKVEWGYDVVAEKALYNADPTRTINFEHHPSDETTMVMKILELAGVIIQNPGVMQYADQEDLKKIQQQKS